MQIAANITAVTFHTILPWLQKKQKERKNTRQQIDATLIKSHKSSIQFILKTLFSAFLCSFFTSSSSSSNDWRSIFCDCICSRSLLSIFGRMWSVFCCSPHQAIQAVHISSLHLSIKGGTDKKKLRDNSI